MGDARVRAFVSSLQTAQIYLSVLTFGELRRGAFAKRGSDPDFFDELMTWIAAIECVTGDRVCPVTVEIANRWGEMTTGRTRANTDALLAATASVYGLTVVTRNVADFQDFGVPVINPWDV